MDCVLGDNIGGAIELFGPRSERERLNKKLSVKQRQDSSWIYLPEGLFPGGHIVEEVCDGDLRALISSARGGRSSLRKKYDYSPLNTEQVFLNRASEIIQIRHFDAESLLCTLKCR